VDASGSQMGWFIFFITEALVTKILFCNRHNRDDLRTALFAMRTVAIEMKTLCWLPMISVNFFFERL
jgi:hypothetical protein